MVAKKNLIKIALTILLMCLTPLSNAQEKIEMSQNKPLVTIEKMINDSASTLGISNVKVTITSTKEGSAQALISYKGNEEKILFTKDEVENASKGIFSAETKNKITETMSQLPPRIGPTFKPRN